MSCEHRLLDPGIDNTVQVGTQRAIAIRCETITASGNMDVHKHLQVINGCNNSSVCSRQYIELLISDVRENFIFTRTNLTLRTCERSNSKL